MSATIRSAPSGENTTPQDSDAFPVTGSQYIQLSTLSAYVNDNVFDSDIQFTDNVTGDADSDNHGYLPKLPGDSDQYLDGVGAWGVPNFLAPTGSGAGLTGITYAVVSGNDSDTDVTGAQLEELSDGSTTTLHAHTESGQYRQFVTIDDGSNGWEFVSVDDGTGQYDPVFVLTDLE